MDISVLFQQIFETLSKATELAISNNKAIAALTQSQSELTAKLTEAVADDEEDTARIAAFEAEKQAQELAIADITKKLEDLKAQLEATPTEPLPPVTEPAPPVEPLPVPVDPNSEIPGVIETTPVGSPAEVIPAENAPTTPGSIGVFEQIVLPGSSPQIF